MTKNEQNELLSVKSAIERTLMAYEATYDSTQKVIEETEKYVATLFVSGQINKDFTVDAGKTRIDIKFSTGRKGHEHFSSVTYLFSGAERKKPTTSTPTVVSMQVKTPAWPFPTGKSVVEEIKAHEHNGKKNLTVEEDPNVAYERAMKPLHN